jgi:hypothetical protein
MRIPCAVLAAAALAISACASTEPEPDIDPENLCEEANRHLADCLGMSIEDPTTCDEDAARAVLGQTCEELEDSSDRADGVFDSVLCSFGFRCRCAPIPNVPAEQVIDDDSDRFGCGGPCRHADSGGFNGGSYTWAPTHHGANGSWQLPIGERATYRVRAWIPAHEGIGSASYDIATCSGTTPVANVSHSVAEGGWIDLAELPLEPGASLSIRGAGGDFFLCDAIELSKL